MYFLVPLHPIQLNFFGNKANFAGGIVLLKNAMGTFHIPIYLFL